MAEENFMIHNNIEEASTLANMAKHLNPHFNTIDNFIAAYGVHVAASHKKPDGEGGIDWYAVLGLASSVFADAKTAKKHYKMLALMVHPDKNSSVAAESAFKLMSQAWKVISSQASTEKTNDNLWNNSTQKASKSNPLRRSSSWGTTRASSSQPTPPSWWPSSFCSQECLKCSRRCSYLSKKQSCIYCFHCNRKFIFPSASKPRHR